MTTLTLTAVKKVIHTSLIQTDTKETIFKDLTSDYSLKSAIR